MPHSREDHGQVMLIASGDYFGIFLRPPRLDNGRSSGPGDFLNPIPLGEEGIGGHHRPFNGEISLHYGELTGIHPAHLAGSDSYRLIPFLPSDPG